MHLLFCFPNACYTKTQAVLFLLMVVSNWPEWSSSAFVVLFPNNRLQYAQQHHGLVLPHHVLTHTHTHRGVISAKNDSPTRQRP